MFSLKSKFTQMAIFASMLVTRFRVFCLLSKWLLTLLIATKTLSNRCVIGLNGLALLPLGMMIVLSVVVKPSLSINGTHLLQVIKYLSGTPKEEITIDPITNATNSQ
jgi:hypothetical protein